MIPLRIEATNFRGIQQTEIELSNVDVACVVGENGACKSTLFSTAPMFSLFGWMPKGLDLEKMVRNGQSGMATALEFEHRGEVYRTARTYSKKGKGKSTLELQRRNGDGWDPLSGTTIKETEEKIRTLLSLDANTFINSSMILQGAANRFTAALPSERKEVLKKVIGLDSYDRLLEAAKARAKVAEIELEKAKAKLADLDGRLKERPQAEKDREHIKNELDRVAGEIATKEAELRKAEEDVRQAQAKVDKAEELKKQIDGLKAEVAKLEAEKREQNERLAWAKKRLDREAEILEKSADHEKVKEKITTLKAKQPQLQKLEDDEKRIGEDMARIEDELRTLGARIKEAERLLADRPALLKAAEQYREINSTLDGMEYLAEQWSELDAAAKEAESAFERSGLEFENRAKAMETEINTLSAKVAMLAKSNCLDPEKATCKFLADARAAKEKLAIVQKQYDSLDTCEVDKAHSLWAVLQDNRDAIGYDSLKHRRLKDLVAELRPKAEQAAQLEGKAELLETLKQQQTRQREEVQNLQQQAETKKGEAWTLAEELKPLPDLEKRLAVLATWVKAKEELTEARAKKAAVIERLKPLDTEIAEKNARVITLESERCNLLNEAAGLSDTKTKLSAINTEVGSLREEQNSLFGRQGAVKAKLESLSKDDEERQRIAAEIEPTAKSLVRWQTLIKAFGRGGIPALIIENAVPELERIAGEILGQMTNGQQSIRFETQKELKSKAGTADTLDIWVEIWDEPGPRIYESFSGGEQLRIDFALRFALAELLARRAGAKIEWLTVDEGLGSQDSEHRELVLEAIKRVADRFRKTFVITHIESAQAVFEQQIFLEKRDGKVEVKVA